MRVTCPHCHSRAIITSNNSLSENVTDLYCQCKNTQTCGASFVFTLAFKHDLNPPQQTTLQIITTLMSMLNSEQRRRLQQTDMFG